MVRVSLGLGPIVRVIVRLGLGWGCSSTLTTY